MTPNNKYDAVCIAFESAYPGVDIAGIYCQFTGKQVGNSHEIDGLIDSLDMDPEQAADDIALRIFASMRPGLRWNKMRPESLDEMRKAEPVQTLAYLLNRLFTPIDRGDQIAINHDRIKVYNRCADWGITDSTNTLLYYLLEIDARLGLKSEWPTFRLEDVLAATDDESIKSLLLMVEAWHGKRVEHFHQLQKEHEQSSRWWRTGDALARPAFFSAFMESQPLSATAKIKLAKREESDMFASLLYEIMGKPNLDGKETLTPPEPKKINLPSTRMPMAFGVKKVEG